MLPGEDHVLVQSLNDGQQIHLLWPRGVPFPFPRHEKLMVKVNTKNGQFSSWKWGRKSTGNIWQVISWEKTAWEALLQRVIICLRSEKWTTCFSLPSSLPTCRNLGAEATGQKSRGAEARARGVVPASRSRCALCRQASCPALALFADRRICWLSTGRSPPRSLSWHLGRAPGVTPSWAPCHPGRWASLQSCRRNNLHVGCRRVRGRIYVQECWKSNSCSAPTLPEKGAELLNARVGWAWRRHCLLPVPPWSSWGMQWGLGADWEHGYCHASLPSWLSAREIAAWSLVALSQELSPPLEAATGAPMASMSSFSQTATARPDAVQKTLGIGLFSYCSCSSWIWGVTSK